MSGRRGLVGLGLGPDYKAYTRCGAGLSPEGGPGSLRQKSPAAVHPVIDPAGQSASALSHRIRYMEAERAGRIRVYGEVGDRSGHDWKRRVRGRRSPCRARVVSCPRGLIGTAEPGSPFHRRRWAAPQAMLARPYAHQVFHGEQSRRCRRRPALRPGYDSPAWRYSRGGVRPPWPVRTVSHLVESRYNGQGPNSRVPMHRDHARPWPGTRGRPKNGPS